MKGELKKTPLYAWHREHGGQMVEFGGWEMPISYKKGIIEEDLGTRRYGGLFDISHMGRFSISGKDAVPFKSRIVSISPILACCAWKPLICCLRVAPRS